MLGGGDGLLAEHTLARAGRVDEHPVKLPGHRRGQAGGVLVRDDGVRHAHSLEILAQNFSAGGDEFIGEQQALPLQSRRQLAGLASRRGAEVGHPHTRLHVQQRSGGRGTRLLCIEHARVVPGVPPRAEVRRRRKGRGAEWGRLCVKVRMLREPFRRAAQRVDRYAAGRLRRGVGVQLRQSASPAVPAPAR